MVNVIAVTELGNQLLIKFDDGSKSIAYPTPNKGFWTVSNSFTVDPTLISDTISPLHSITNPGGTIADGWQWHLDNNSNRGGADFDYNFQTFTAPAAGTVTHFDITGVGMVVKLVLDTPAIRINPQLTTDAYGPMTAIWFQHCSAAVDGHAEMGDIIGTSGDGYGAYSPHLHVHGMINNTNSSPSTARCNFWGFV
jgi:hypothetical protein